MKQLLLLFAICIANPFYAQKRDTLAELKVRGRINEISVSPAGKIWLVTAVGKTYYSDNIHSVWHYGKSFAAGDDDDYSAFGPTLERINFFDEDRAVLSGYISSKEGGSSKDGLYLTKDGGKTWTLLNCGGDSWMYCSFSNEHGKEWMGGLNQKLFYTDDYGDTWKTITMKYKRSDRTYSIQMLDDMNGIAGSDNNEIVITHDNWKTVTTIPTPLDQELFKRPESGYSDERIGKVVAWGDYYVVNQNGHIFYSEKNNVQWKKFDAEIAGFEVDETAQSLYLITSDLRMSIAKTPDKLMPLCKEKLHAFPLDMKVVNGSLFVVDGAYGVYKINQDEFSFSGLYTNDHKIETPEMIRKGKNLYWGTTGTELYLSDNEGKDWFRVKAPDVYISDFNLVNDSLATLWNGKRNFYYQLGTDTALPFVPDDPLKEFLDSPITGFHIESGSRGCFHGFETFVDYELSDTAFQTKESVRNEYREDTKKKYHNTVSRSALRKILEEFNADPEHIPSIKEFGITEKDKKDYRSYIDELVKEAGWDSPVTKKNKDFYYSIAEKLDTISPAVMKAVLNWTAGGWSTTKNWFFATIYTEDHDTLTVDSNSYSMSNEREKPAHLPWRIEFNGQHLTCFSASLSRYIDSAIPDDFFEKDQFDNKVLILQIALYLNGKRQKEE